MKGPAGQDERLERIRSGDSEAFGAMVREYYPGLLDYAAGITRDAHAARDVVQDVLANVWENHAGWSPEAGPRAYLYRAVRNRAVNYAQRRRPTTDTPDHQPYQGNDPTADLAWKDLVRDYQAAMEELPPRRRQVYQLCHLHGLSYEEAAAVLDVSVNTVKAQMKDALSHLRTALGDHLK